MVRRLSPNTKNPNVKRLVFTIQFTHRQNGIHIIQQGIQIFHWPIPLLVSDYKLPPGTAAGEHPPPLLRVDLEGGHRSESLSSCGPLGSHTFGPGNRVVENIIEVSIATTYTSMAVPPPPLLPLPLPPLFAPLPLFLTIIPLMDS